jgi:hypothetical protein
MKEGIYLGPPRARRLVRKIFVVVALVATAVSSTLSYVSHRRAAVLEDDVARLRSASTSAPRALTGDEALTRLRRLRAVADSGALASIAPTEVLTLVASTLPEDMQLESLSAATAPPSRNLLLEATTTRPDDVSALQRRMSTSSLVSGTELLEERLLAEGALAVRLQVTLAGPSTR